MAGRKEDEVNQGAILRAFCPGDFFIFRGIEMDYKYFIRYDCSFYRCHNPSDLKSCLFCWCPLYLLNCDGAFVIRNGIKDCSECTTPHTEEGCNYVLETVNSILGQVKLTCSLPANGLDEHYN